MSTSSKLALSLPALLALLVAAPPTARAMPARPAVRTVQQPDGRSIELVRRGDERGHWDETPDGYTAARAADGAWRYVRSIGPQGAVLEAAKVGGPRPLSLATHVHPPLDGGGIDLDVTPFDTSELASGPQSPAVLMILLEYDNVPSTYNSARKWSRKIASTDANAKTIADFYQKASYGNVTISPAAETHKTNDDGVIGWLHINAPHPDPEGKSGAAREAAYDQITDDALNGADPFINYQSYELNGDGGVGAQELAIIIVVAGYEAASGTVPAGAPSLWGRMHMGGIKMLDGVFVMGDVAEIGEVQLGSTDHQATLGVMVHELGHLVFALPDLYDLDFSSSGLGSLSTMAYGAWGQASGDVYPGETPVEFDAWSQFRLGWVTASSGTFALTMTAAGHDVVPVTPPVVGIANVPSAATPPFACSIKEFFLAQYRTLSGYDAGLELLSPWFGAFTPGVVIFHVDETRPDNTTDSRRLVDTEEATPTSPLYGVGGTFSPTTSPNSNANAGHATNIEMSVLSTAVSAAGDETARVKIVSPCNNTISTGPVGSPTGPVSFP